MKTDKKGRITKIDEGDDIHTGHSVCNNCGKNMPICWDVVCNKCRKTFCYVCSVVVKGFWNCFECRDKK